MKSNLKSEIKTKVFCCEYGDDGQIYDPDISIILDKEKISCHKIILATYSEIFAKTLSQNPTIKEVPLGTDYHISGPTLRLILRFLYTSELKITDASDIERLKEAGEKLKIPYILQKCQSLENQKVPASSTTDSSKIDKKTCLEVPSQTTPTVEKEKDVMKYLRFARDKGKFDMEIVSKDIHFPVHSIIVRQFCGYIDRHLPFQLEATEAQPYIYTLLPGLKIGEDILADILLYVYSGRISLMPGKAADELMRSAKILEMGELVKFLNLYSDIYQKHSFPLTMPQQVDTTSAEEERYRHTAPVIHLSKLKLADIKPRLKGKAHFGTEPEDSFKNRYQHRGQPRDNAFLVDREVQEVCQFLGQDYFMPDRDEIKLFDLALAWIKNDFPRRLFHIEKVMRFIKFHTMTAPQLNYCFQTSSNFLELSPYLRNLLLNAYKHARP